MGRLLRGGEGRRRREGDGKGKEGREGKEGKEGEGRRPYRLQF